MFRLQVFDDETGNFEDWYSTVTFSSREAAERAGRREVPSECEWRVVGESTEPPPPEGLRGLLP